MGKKNKRRNQKNNAPAGQPPATITMSTDELKKVIVDAIVQAEQQKEDFSKYKTTGIISVVLCSLFFLIFAFTLIFGSVLLFQISTMATVFSKINILFAGLFLLLISPVFLYAAFEILTIKDSSYLWGAFASVISLLALIVSIISAAK